MRDHSTQSLVLLQRTVQARGRGRPRGSQVILLEHIGEKRKECINGWRVSGDHFQDDLKVSVRLADRRTSWKSLQRTVSSSGSKISQETMGTRNRSINSLRLSAQKLSNRARQQLIPSNSSILARLSSIQRCGKHFAKNRGNTANRHGHEVRKRTEFP